MSNKVAKKLIMIKVISYGNKNRIKTAQIVIVEGGRSITKHLWQTLGNVYSDMWGTTYNLK